MSLPDTHKAIIPGPGGEPLIADIPTSKPSANQVLVKVEFAPINPTDLIKFKGGFYGKPGDLASSIGGSEGSGIIVAVGDNLNIPHKVGDRVHVKAGSWTQYQLASSEDVSPILQPDLSLEEAASHWVNPATVHHMGFVAEKGGHKAAIHTAGSSALGRMLIRYFKEKGIKLINIVRKDEYIEELKKEGADYVLNSQAPDFAVQLKELAHKENATISFDAIAGDFPNLLVSCQPSDSYVYVYGVLSSNSITNLNRVELSRGSVVAGLFLRNYIEKLKEKNELGKVTEEVHKLLPTVFKSHVQKVYSFQDVKEAFEYYDKNSSKGKILLKFN